MSTSWLVPILTSALLSVLGLYFVERRALTRAVLSERKRHAEALDGLNASHREELARTAALYDRLLANAERTATESIRLATTGQAQPAVATVERRVVDPVEEARRVVRNDTLDRGVEALREAYRAIGVQFNDDDLRQEAEALLAGLVPTLPSPTTPAPFLVRE